MELKKEVGSHSFGAVHSDLCTYEDAHTHTNSVPDAYTDRQLTAGNNRAQRQRLGVVARGVMNIAKKQATHG